MWIAFLDHLAYDLDSFWHRASPVSKVVFLILAISAIIISTKSLYLAALFVLFLLLMSLSNLPVFTLSLLLLYPLFFGLVFSLSRVGEAATFPLVTLLRAVTAAEAVLLVLATTHYVDLFAVLQIVLPYTISDTMFITYRSFFMILDSLRNTVNIARLRGAYSFFTIFRNLRLAGRVLGHSLIHAYQTNETTQRALILRGYEGRIITSRSALRLSHYDFVIFFLGILLLVLAVVGVG
ncbi:MAG: hypothetical protein E3J54_06270 [Actinobacteria bacterium]|nr:MAG: hypothetical protein E3J54_06270 [Actinomycetota bacterium]